MASKHQHSNSNSNRRREGQRGDHTPERRQQRADAKRACGQVRPQRVTQAPRVCKNSRHGGATASHARVVVVCTGKRETRAHGKGAPTTEKVCKGRKRRECV